MRASRSASPILFLVVAGGMATASGCAGIKSENDAGSTMPGTDGGRAGVDAPARADRTPVIIVTPGVCGDGERTADEACDDSNTTGDDGCAADCRSVDPGFSCIPAGKPCHRIARCGDGVVVLPELCDDGNAVAGDGCSATCKVELGFKCSGNPSVCTHTTCGDKIVEGAEGCDDGNSTPYDGCSADCTSEPNCTSTTGACASRCGDGIVVGEACDDGNNLDGDGCTADCKIEPGFMCQQPPLGDRMLVPAVFRDFRAHMPADFQPSALGKMTPTLGIVGNALDGDGKPTLILPGAASLITSQDTFKTWYRDTPGTNHTTTGKITLWNKGDGSFVNRYGANGEPWPLTTIAYFCGGPGQGTVDPATGLEIPCTFKFGMSDCDKNLALGYKQLSCYVNGGSWSALFQTGNVDGQPFFFPVDGDNFTPASERSSAATAPPYDANYGPEAGMPLHNFHFTSEVRYWFQYDATKTYTLDFTGDDDVWVFINRRLAVDLGGIHTPQQGSITISAASAAQFGISDGQVYEVEVFQAERQTNGSSYRLTLSGFSAAPSDCRPICGDGILGIGEECDDGMNLGGYGECGPGCKLSAFCGDGIVQPEEDCDDGVNIGRPCPSGCHNLIIPP
jgi:fibro-slime domain-containing protein